MASQRLQIYQILGIVKNTKRSPGEDSSSTITVTSISTQKDHHIFCPFYCPARKNDVLSGICIPRNDGILEFVQCPVVEPSSTKEVVQNVFLIGMGKLKMSQYMSDRVYDFFRKDTFEKIKRMSTEKSPDKGSSDSTIFRNRDSLNAAIMETISWYANNFRTDEFVAEPLINLGLSKEQAHKLLRSWYRSFCLRRLYLLGLTRKEIRECCERGWAGAKCIVNSPDALYYQLLENPYIPEKIPLLKAQNIALRYGLTFNQDIIECADLIRFVDEQTNENGWACYPIFTLLKRYPRFHELSETLKLQFKCSIRYNFLYLRHQAETEDTLVEYLKSRPLSETHASEETKSRLCPEQVCAVELTLNNSVSIITGGGGVGKTTVISAIVQELELREISWCIGSFTGKAIANVKKIVRRRENIMTLHMILSKGKIVDKFDRPVKVLIIDEISMVPNELLAKVLLKLNYALSSEERLQVILVGDQNQVQPIEWGDFFNQVLMSWIFGENETQGKLAIPWIQLTEDHRRRTKGVLFNNMAQFVTGERPEDIVFEWGNDCEFIQGGIVELENTIRKLHHQGVLSDEVTVISPINKGLDDINLRIQNIFISLHAPCIRDAFGNVWKLGARVMMTVNRYDINIMNGEEGTVIGILSEKSCIKVRFQNGLEVDIPTFIPAIIDDKNEVDDIDLEQPLSTKLLVLSWAITVHKSQGSQWKYVLFYIPPNIGKGSFFNRNLLYTGVSRTQDHLYVVAPYEYTFTSAILVDPPKRFDNLSKRFKGEEYVDRYVDPNQKMQQQILMKAMANTIV